MIYYLDVKSDGLFVSAGIREINRNSLDTQWFAIQKGVSSLQAGTHTIDLTFLSSAQRMCNFGCSS